ncbi:Lpg1974 family pore-forming outer membrane protein [Tabrizicola sp.]|uniref:Lpg1974 family pore-forming outer membrane protein n=1 Tax=Tabrizicola sp. TaxID=2005166 RepID=UPI00263136EE|nr:Lpg1974 family pore-forming outer membrane protein [Tabrizicola sp.]MDM7933037.1 Lpg1974 family pore-forming outer membrane protein [Tabrizicola sp.]
MKTLLTTTGMLSGLLLATSASAEGLSFGLEIPILTIYADHGAGEIDGGNAWFDEDGSANAFRITAAYDISESFGVRGRVFKFDGEFDDPDDQFDARTIDVEAVMNTDLGGLDLDVFAGLRSGSVDWSDEDGSTGYGFDGVGPTIGLQVTHSFGNGLGMIVGGRYSAMLGDTTELTSDDTADNVVVSSVDLRIGLDYARDLASGGSMTFGVGVESTSFLSLSGNVDNDIDPEDVSVTLAGPYLSLGFTF